MHIIETNRNLSTEQEKKGEKTVAIRVLETYFGCCEFLLEQQQDQHLKIRT